MHMDKTTSKSALEMAADECKGEPADRQRAEEILARMNDMIRDRNFAKISGERRFQHLQSELYDLGWLALVKKLKVKGGELRVQLKLVDPNSAEARELM